jgi:hypothetical protein
MSQADRKIGRLFKELGQDGTAKYLASLNGYADARLGEASNEMKYHISIRKDYLIGYNDGQKTKIIY